VVIAASLHLVRLGTLGEEGKKTPSTMEKAYHMIGKARGNYCVVMKTVEIYFKSKKEKSATTDAEIAAGAYFR
jgi:hypothetical protein